MAMFKKLLLTIALLTSFSVGVFARDDFGAGRWALAQVHGRDVTGSKAYIEFGENGRFSGNAGCNRMFGTVEVIGRRVEFSPVGTTRMACLEKSLSRLETDFVNALREAKRYRLAGNTLVLLDGGRVVLRFTKTTGGGQGTAAELEGRKWMLEQIAGKKVSKNGQKAFLVFNPAERSAGGDTSCNAFGGSYTVNGSKLEITDVISTMRACVEDDRMEIERKFLDALRQTDGYRIEEGKLMLVQGKKVLLTLRSVER